VVVDHFLLVYLIDEEKKYVNLVRVIYGKRNIKQILQDIQ